MAFLSCTAILPKVKCNQEASRSTGRRNQTQVSCCVSNRHSPSSHSMDMLLETLRANRAQNLSDNRRDFDANVGTVYLLGTGPGDPGLLTLHALLIMDRADVVLYDRLVSDSILSFVNPQATMVYVGKEAGFHTRSQEDIHLLLLFFARSHSVVVRLKGGDPFVFGRGGEETEFLERAGIHVVAVPGITAASGIAAALGIPLTMRGYATSVRYLTGHVSSGVNLDCGTFDRRTTYVIYMGLSQLETLANEMMKHGLDSDTPSVAVHSGTTPQQRLLPAQLYQLPELVTSAKFKSPTLIIIGQVVSLAPCWDQAGLVVESNQYGQIGNSVTPSALHGFLNSKLRANW